MAGVNKVIIVGNLGKDPEIRNSQYGKIASFTVATSDTWNDRASGERRERTEWHKVVVFNEHLVDVVERFLRKGRKVYLEGSLQTRKWTDQGGQERYTTEIVLAKFKGEIQLLDRRDDSNDQGGGADGYGETGGGGGYGGGTVAARPAQGGAGDGNRSWDYSGGGGADGDLDDEVPF